MDSVENILDRLIGYDGVFDSNRSMKNPGSSKILVNNIPRSSDCQRESFLNENSKVWSSDGSKGTGLWRRH